jgi:hypothetical protein
VKRTPLKRMSRKQKVKKRLWQQARRETESRANGWCEAHIDGVCVGRGCHAHHIRRRAQGGADDPSNLAWVCAPCHDWIHRHPWSAYEQGLLARTTAET